MFQNNKSIKQYFLIDLAFWISILLFLVGLIFHFRAVSSISIFLILIFSLIHNKINTNNFFVPQIKTLFLFSCSLFFGLKLIALIYTDNFIEGVSNVRITSALLFVPLAIYNSANFLNSERIRKIIIYHTIILLSAVIYCLIIAINETLVSGNQNNLFYHQLVSPLNHHAIHFSFLLFFNIVFLTTFFKKEYFILNKLITLSIIIVFSIVLILLSSKLVLFCYLIYIIYLFLSILNAYSSGIKYVYLLLPISLIILLFFTSNPISNRFKDLTTTNIDQLKQKEFGEGYYFNGLQFRLIQWRFVSEVLEEENTWIAGVTPGDSQSLLDRKYSEVKMYSGKPGTNDTGFFGLNTHNQFLQALLELGLIGLISFLFICASLIKMSFLNNNYNIEAIFINWTLILFCFTDTPLETQYSILLFLFFPAFYSVYNNLHNKK